MPFTLPLPCRVVRRTIESVAFIVAVGVLASVAPMPAAAQEAKSDAPAPCVVRFDLPDDAQLTVDGRDYGTARKLTFSKLKAGKDYKSKMTVTFPGGGVAERQIALRAGEEYDLSLDDFLDRDDPQTTYRHPLVATSTAPAAISPDGKQVAVLTPDKKEAALFDLESGELLLRFAAHAEAVRSIAFSPDGRRLATCGEDNVVQVFDTANGKLVRKITPPEYPKRGMTSSGVPYRPLRPFQNLGEAVGSAIGDAIAGAFTEPFISRLSHVHSVAFSPDGRRLLSSEYDGSVRLWDLTNGRQVLQYCGHRFAYSNDLLPVINSAAFSFDGRRVVAADRSGYVRVWETSSGRSLLRIRADANNALSAQFSPDGKHLLTLGADGVARIWDAKSGEHLHMLYPGKSAEVRVARFAPDGTVMTLGTDTAVRFWDAATGEEIRRLPVGPAFVAKHLLVVDPSGQSLLTDGMLGYQTRSVESGQIQHLFRAPKEQEQE